MKKTRKLILLAIVCSTLAPSCLAPGVAFGVYTSSQASSNDISSSTYYKMVNGDYSLGGVGSVTEELTQSGFDFNSVISRTHYEVVAVAEKDSSLYIYVAAPLLDYSGVRMTHASIAVQESDSGEIDIDDQSALLFARYELRLSSYDASQTYFKYQVMSDKIISSKSNRVYTVRQIEHYDFANDKTDVYPVSTSYAFSDDSSKAVVRSEDYYDISKKVVKYELLDNGYSHDNFRNQIIQKNYCLFSFSDNADISKITRIALSYDYQFFGGRTSVPFVNEKASDLYNIDLKKNIADKGTNSYSSSVISGNYTIVEEGQTEIVSKPDWLDPVTLFPDPFKWLLGTSTKKTYKNITDISAEDASNWQNWDFIKDYQYLVWFNDTPFNVGGHYATKYWIMPSVSYQGIIIPGHWGYNPDTSSDYVVGCPSSWLTGDFNTPLSYFGETGSGQAFTPASGASPIHVTDLTLLQFWYVSNAGELKDKIIVDDYTDSTGGQQIIAPVPIPNNWDKFVSWLKSILDNLLTWLQAFWKVLVWAVVAIFGGFLIVKFVQLLTNKSKKSSDSSSKKKSKK